MQSFPSEKLEQLIAEQKWDDLKIELKKWLTENEQPEGEAMLNAARLYLKVKNHFDAEYLKELKELTALAKDLNKASESVDSDDKAAKIKHKLKDL